MSEQNQPIDTTNIRRDLLTIFGLGAVELGVAAAVAVGVPAWAAPNDEGAPIPICATQPVAGEDIIVGDGSVILGLVNEVNAHGVNVVSDSHSWHGFYPVSNPADSASELVCQVSEGLEVDPVPKPLFILSDNGQRVWRILRGNTDLPAGYRLYGSESSANPDTGQDLQAVEPQLTIVNNED